MGTCHCFNKIISDVLQVLACGGDYDSPAGFIDFPPGEGTEYGHSLACDYTIRVAEGKVTNIILLPYTNQ